jgi:hypothetical protein
MNCKCSAARSARSAMAGSTPQKVAKPGGPSLTTGSPTSNQDSRSAGPIRPAFESANSVACQASLSRSAQKAQLWPIGGLRAMASDATREPLIGFTNPQSKA